MGWMVFFGLIAWPILEIAVFVQVGEWIGWLNAIALFLCTAVAGLWLLRSEGVSLLLRARRQMQDGIAPVDEAFDALCLVTGGVLLLLPGFLTDIAALFLFLPPTRRALKRLIARHTVVVQGAAGGPYAPREIVIEGEFEEIRPEQTHGQTHGPSSGQPNGPAKPLNKPTQYTDVADDQTGDVVPKRE